MCRCDDDFEFVVVVVVVVVPRVRDVELPVTEPMIRHYYVYSNCWGDFVEAVMVLIQEQRPTRLRE